MTSKFIRLIFFAAVLMILAVRCGDTQITAPEIPASGSVKMLIAAVSAPKNVVRLTATFTRSGFSLVSAELLISGTEPVEWTITHLAPGGWILTVNALDTDGKIIYSAQTTLTATISCATVMLTLLPV